MRKRQIKSTAILTAILLSLSLTLTACDSDDDDVTGVDAPATSRATTAVEVSGTDDTPTGSTTDREPLNADQKEATENTAAVNKSVYDYLDFSDRQEFEFAQKGLIAAPDALEIKDENGNVVFSQSAFAFVNEHEEDEDGHDCPDSANPSLWRHTQLNHVYGLFEVMDGIYQVRGYDLTNLTLIRSDNGWIIFDVGTSVETMRAAFELVTQELGELPVMGVIISHPHVDHYSGIAGVISAEEFAEREIPLIVPQGFLESLTKENIYAGIAMSRRASYQYGTPLPPGPLDRLAIGLGVSVPVGTSSFYLPTREITHTGETVTIDGVEMVFQITPGTEAPTEMNTWFPQKNALWMAENCVGTMHNLYTLRGAEVRDANAWATYLMESQTLWGDDVDVVFQSHNWPRWGNDVIKEYMTNTAAVYKFIHDQTLMYVNQGYVPNDIANMIRLPDDLNSVWYTRGYYGTLAHDSKAVYQKYMGWYDANPAHLNPLSPGDSAKKLVEYLGDIDAVLEMARRDFDNGEYQWVAEITNAIVYADPDNLEARYLCADALEQLGYQSEAGTWRSPYLMGAGELRGTINPEEVSSDSSSVSPAVLRAMQPNQVLDYLGIHLDSNAAQDINMTVNYIFSDGADPYLVTVKSGVMLYQKGATADDADVTFTLPSGMMFVLMQSNSWDDATTWDNVEGLTVEGDLDLLAELASNLVDFDPYFDIVVD